MGKEAESSLPTTYYACLEIGLLVVLDLVSASASCKSPTFFPFGGEDRSMGNACSSRTRTYIGSRLCKLNHKDADVQLPHAFLIPSLGSKSPPLQRDWQDPARTHQDNARAPLTPYSIQQICPSFKIPMYASIGFAVCVAAASYVPSRASPGCFRSVRVLSEVAAAGEWCVCNVFPGVNF
ncbi:hypothetical protein IQ07DRAFT_387272 [Pyrenochaeta sp. DS3sAY3a]|nr:hypothetical protein IQ07DRAFT_387272 [Pyrenochaeta sp. DS3sAY3a]